MMVLGKRAASGAGALLASVRRRLDLLSGVDAPRESQPFLPLDDPIEDDEAPCHPLAAPGLHDLEEERRVLQSVAALASAAKEGDSKLRVLCRLLSRSDEPAIVFTEYRDTLVRLSEVLVGLGRVVMLHGGLGRAERVEAINEFTHGGARILLATDAAAHGLNLHSTCRLVVNLDLPWTPVRLEQRIGRVDRIGQRRRVHVVHLAARGTFEDLVLARLAMRVERARRSVGVGESPLGRIGELEVASYVFGAWLAEPHSDAGVADARAETAYPADGVALKPDLRREAEAEAERLGAIRQLARPRGKGADPLQALSGLERSGPWCGRLTTRTSRLGAGTYLLYRVRVVDGRGSLLDETVVPIHVKHDASAGPRRLTWRETLEADRKACQVIIEEAATARLRGTQSSLGAALRVQSGREASIAKFECRPPAPVQPGLFDRRALRAAGEDAALRLDLRAETTVRLRALRRASRIELSEAQLLLVLIVEVR
ncbi:MAG: hypothetical protein EHM13_02775 [Acidobacteria bacterium]|nr:MAG: hypothetical protein EHM13_02775 [Acidobacteriota bacterium]